jgi:hypothetical protein
VQQAGFLADSLLQHVDLTTFAAQPAVQVPDLQQSPLQLFWPQHLPSVQQAVFVSRAFARSPNAPTMVAMAAKAAINIDRR